MNSSRSIRPCNYTNAPRVKRIRSRWTQTVLFEDARRRRLVRLAQHGLAARGQGNANRAAEPAAGREDEARALVAAEGHQQHAAAVALAELPVALARGRGRTRGLAGDAAAAVVQEHPGLARARVLGLVAADELRADVDLAGPARRHQRDGGGGHHGQPQGRTAWTGRRRLG